ncbi:DMT family transporter [Brevibacillus sp. SYP-B805]|uniref:DMT family transporter n=1 Tax=Brevibacillus sp. SYP-B805 TaxID=1578199 RepID=UPI0013ED321A|nr:DMT family transporter [Brevibacillus sp. SYP-B805]NGQ97181.1 DMT family transporter [Brevibacillus sp. SYP-B805]
MLGKERRIIMILCAVVTVWGLNVVMVKYLSFFPPVLLAAIRMTIGSLFLLPIILWKQGFVRVRRQDLLLIAGVALSMITLHQITLAWGLQYTSAGTGSLILGLNPLSTALLAMIFLGEEMTRRKVLGVLMGFGGVLIVVTSGSGGVELNGWGDLIMFVSMLMYVIGGLLVRKLTTRGVPVLIVTGYSHALAALLLWFISVIIYPATTFAAIDTRPFTWLVIVASGGVSTGLGSIGWNYGIRQLGASRTAVFLNGMPLASLIFSAVLLGEELKWVHALAFALVVLGVFLGAQGAAAKPRRLEQLEA